LTTGVWALCCDRCSRICSFGHGLSSRLEEREIGGLSVAKGYPKGEKLLIRKLDTDRQMVTYAGS
jgi:hypothetical protein